MVKKQVSLYLCDKCGKEGHRYTILFEDGALRMDRCETHAKKLENLRNEEGEWEPVAAKKSGTFQKSSITDLREAVARGSMKQGEDS